MAIAVGGYAFSYNNIHLYSMCDRLDWYGIRAVFFTFILPVLVARWHVTVLRCD